MEPQEDIKQISDEAFKEIYAQFGTSTLNLQAELIKEFTNNQLMFYMKTLEFFYQMVAVIGIFAGFGFTALSNVKVLPLFLLGELTLISMIIYSLNTVRTVYKNEHDGLENTKNKYRDNIFEPYNKLLGKVVNDFIEQKAIHTEDIKKLKGFSEKLYEMMGSTAKIKYVDPFTTRINWILVAAVLGSVMILLSLIDYTSIYILFTLC